MRKFNTKPKACEFMKLTQSTQYFSRCSQSNQYTLIQKYDRHCDLAFDPVCRAIKKSMRFTAMKTQTMADHTLPIESAENVITHESIGLRLQRLWRHLLLIPIREGRIEMIRAIFPEYHQPCKGLSDPTEAKKQAFDQFVALGYPSAQGSTRAKNVH